jgi:diguanylate cyclase (GGDEF)-like protein
MTLHPPTLLTVCGIAVLLAAATLTWFGARQSCYRGYWFWVTAQWLLGAGLVLQVGAASSDLVSAAAHLLVLQWPICVLAGLRRFYSRHGLPVHGGIDLGMLALAWLSVAMVLQTRASPSVELLAWCVGPMLLQAYVAVLVTRLAEFKSSPALQFLAIGLVAAALANGYRLAFAGSAPATVSETLLASSAIMVLPAIAMVPVVLMLSFQRTEHTWRAEQRKLRYMADMDVLTRVPNRRHFQQLATETLAATKAEEASVIAFDIDHFKRINEMFGHAAGDDALRQVSQCMRETLRELDVAGRVGSHEFVILLPETLPNGAMAVASRMVAKLAPHQDAPRMSALSLSFGIVRLYEGEAIADALRRAEQALFEARRQGRSRMVVATGSRENPVFTNSRTLGLFGA